MTCQDLEDCAERRSCGHKHCTPDTTVPRLVCPWRVDADSVWWTGCGHGWMFEDGGPTENGTAWCPFCGGRLVEQQFAGCDAA